MLFGGRYVCATVTDWVGQRFEFSFICNTLSWSSDQIQSLKSDRIYEILENGSLRFDALFNPISDKAKVIYAPREVHLAYGRPAILDCHFRANPPLTNLRWEKDGYLFDPYNVQGVFYRRNGSLYFSKVDETHGGLYTCTPYNELGTEGASPNIEVIIQRPPVFVTTPHNMYLRKIGENVEFPCDARDGEEGHKPIIVWYKVRSGLSQNAWWKVWLVTGHVSRLCTSLQSLHFLILSTLSIKSLSLFYLLFLSLLGYRSSHSSTCVVSHIFFWHLLRL